jgi:dTDP-4-dehydrorhamnose reductase
MKILVTGSNGQLGSELKEKSEKYPSFEFLYTDVAELDVTDESAVKEHLNTFRPDVIINCAAYTAVDRAESEANKAFVINSDAVRYLSEASARHGSLLIHISTDYIFNGKAFSPYTESDEADPLSVYGKSKYAGEEAILRYASRALILRTSWLYSSYGNNFVKTIRKLAREREVLNVVYDQIGTPTYAAGVAQTILNILPQASLDSGLRIFHYSDEGVASWYDFAVAVCELSGIKCKINPVRSNQYPQDAVRPLYSVLDKSKIKSEFPIEIPYWRDSLKKCILKVEE